MVIGKIRAGLPLAWEGKCSLGAQTCFGLVWTLENLAVDALLGTSAQHSQVKKQKEPHGPWWHKDPRLRSQLCPSSPVALGASQSLSFLICSRRNCEA